MKTLISNLRVNFAVLLMIVAVSSLSAAQQWGPDSPRALQAFPGINGGSFASEAPNRIIHWPNYRSQTQNPTAISVVL